MQEKKNIGKENNFPESRKINAMEETMAKIRDNIAIVRGNMEKLEKFNFKLKCMIMAREVYSNNTDMSKIENLEDRNDISGRDKKVNDESQSGMHDLFSAEEKAVMAIFEEKSELSLNEVCKYTKINRYKAVGILNEMIAKGILTKEFDRVFIYKLCK